ncbi:DNA-binding MarR family transcriptional regulator [Salinibacterium sp. CAN_S4]|uniref:MarR family winged helix-turn-helix transcriptional regulator n=1 Tax=Salinibacterium sp. CAN_S4 TaxID=2787727 RepID=UPI0018EFC610
MNDDITSSTAFKLHRATALIDRVADAYLSREHGIRYALFLVLLMVRVMGEPSQRAVATALDVSRASITQRVSALVEAGLLRVAPDPADSRANIVSLSRKGAGLVTVAWAGLEQHQDGLDHGVDEPALAAALDRIIANGERILGS